MVDEISQEKYFCEIPIIDLNQCKKDFKQKLVILNTCVLDDAGAILQDRISLILKNKIQRICFEKKLANCQAEFIYIYWNYNIMGGGCNRLFAWWQFYYYKRRRELYQFFDLLEDKSSKEVLCEFLRTIFFEDVYRLPELDTKEKYFGNGLFENRPDEYFLNCGSSTGDTIYHFLENYPEFGKIYAVEGNPKTVKQLVKNVKRLPKKIQKKIEIFDHYIGIKEEEKNEFDQKKISLINMDLEGAELNVLKSCKNIICEQLPILSICVYHKKEDLLEISKWIQSCSAKYRFYLRKYTSSIINVWSSRSELVLYAIPEHRIS